MSSPDDAIRRKMGRRGFLKWMSAVVAVGALATQQGRFIDLIQRLGGGEPGQSPADTAGRMPSQVPPNSFSIFWITDTQFLSESNPALFRKMTDWIVDNWAPYNGKLVIHTGDVVQTGAHQDEWVNADKAMSVFLREGIPYTWCAGNHDDMVQDDSSSGWKGHLWSSAFNPALVGHAINRLEYARWAGDYHDGMNTAVSFKANGLNFLVVNLEWKGDAFSLEWARRLLDDPAYADHYVIVAPHAYINAYGSLNDPRWIGELGDFISGLTPILDDHSSNVILTLNGHFATDCGYNTSTMVNGRNQLMFDRQDSLDLPNSPTGRGTDEAGSDIPDIEKVGGATVTILTFEPDRNQISVKTYDTFVDKWRNDSCEEYTVKMVPVTRGELVPVAAFSS